MVYLPVMAIVSLIGSKEFGGRGILPYGWDMVLVAVLSLVFYYWGVQTGYRSQYLEERETHDDMLEGRRTRSWREYFAGLVKLR